MAAARAAKAAEPRPEKEDAEKTGAAGKAARTRAGAPLPQETKTDGLEGRRERKDEQAAKQGAAPERLPPKPNDEKEARENTTKKRRGKQPKHP